jgi:hypothetical protein
MASIPIRHRTSPRLRRTRGRGRPVRSGIAPVVVAGFVVAFAALSGCSGGKGFADRTAVLTRDNTTLDLTVDACGLDGTTIRVLARADDGTVVQAVLGVLAKDHETGVPASTGITLMKGTTTVGAFGAEAWTRRDKTGAAPGTITAAALRGARIQFSGDLVPLDDQDDPITGGASSPFSFDARCDQHDE